MSDTVKKILNVIYVIVFIVSMYLLIIGQRDISGTGLIKMLIALVGVLSLLYIYNRKYK